MVVNKIRCSLEGSGKENHLRHFQGVLAHRPRNKGLALLKLKITLSLKKLFAQGLTTHHDCTLRNL